MTALPLWEGAPVQDPSEVCACVGGEASAPCPACERRRDDELAEVEREMETLRTVALRAVCSRYESTDREARRAEKALRVEVSVLFRVATGGGAL